MPHIYIIAGEASGDLHASNLIKALKTVGSDWKFSGFGGDKMAAEGVHITQHYREMAFMGFSQVIFNLRKILDNIKICKNDIETLRPDAVIFVDFPGFNLRIAPFAKLLGIKTIYYISPQIWAWKESRVVQIKQHIDLMLCILPFEKDFYKKHNYSVEYVGHPLLDALENYDFPAKENFIDTNQLQKTLVALLPGSRKQEIKALLPTMVQLASKHSDKLFAVACSPSQDLDFYKKIAGHIPDNVLWIKNTTYGILHHAQAAIVASGTATLETALIGTPQIVVYKGNWFNYFIARILIKVKYISLVNLIADKPLVTELIQGEYNVVSLHKELSKLLENKEHTDRLRLSYQHLRKQLGGAGASARAAQLIKNLLQ